MFGGDANLDNTGLFEAMRKEREKKKMLDNSVPPEHIVVDEEKKQVTLDDIPPEQLASLMAELKKEIMQDMKSEAEKKAEEDRLRKEQLRKDRESYVERMKASDEPWMDIEAWDENKTGAKIELDWNDAFIKHLRENGIAGTDDDQVVQKWLILLMEDMTGKMADEAEEGDFE